MPASLESAGARAGREVRWAPLFIEDLWPGMYTNRSALHDPSGLYERKYMGGRPGSLIGGLNTEVSVNNTLIRRYGLSAFSTAVYPTAPLAAYSFELINGTIQVIVDTGATGTLLISSVGAASGGSAVYTGTFPLGGSNAYAGLKFVVNNAFTNASNNGAFLCTASSTTTLTLSNPNAVAETHAAQTETWGAVYLDNQDGTKTMLYAKGIGASQTRFVAVAGILYMGDGVEVRKYTPGNVNGTIWNWGIVAPTAQPSVTIIESGAAAVAWQALTVFSTMGLVADTTTNTTQQLISVNATGTNTTEFGSTGNGQPAWNNTPGGTTTDNSITWTNRGPIVLWTANTLYNNASVGGTAVNPCIIYDPGTKSCYINANPGLANGTSGASYPKFVAGAGQFVHDGGVKWFYLGTPGIPATWQPSHSYPALNGSNDATSSISEPVGLSAGLPSNVTVYWQVSGGGTSAPTATSPKWSTAAGQQTGNGADGDLTWLCLGSDLWTASTNVLGWTVQGTVFTAIKDANGNFQVCLTGGTTATIVPGKSYTLSAAGAHSGANTTYTGTFSPIIPTGTSVTIAGFTNSNNNGTFTVVSCNATQLVVTNGAGVAETHAGTAVYNAWSTVYGGQTTDGTAVWVCVGTALAWAASTIWCLPTSGFSPPSPSSPYGGASVIDTNNVVQFVTNSGKSQTPGPPTWSAIGSSTSDGTITWYALEAYTQQSLAWTKGYAYAVAFKAMATDDFYAVPDPTTNIIPTPPGLKNPLPTPTGSQTGAISSASPAFIITGPNAGAVNTISGFGSTDPQVDTIVIYRSADGGGSDQMFELTEIPAPKPIGGIAQPWSFKDFLPDTPTNLYPGLETLEPAPIDNVNDPPANAFLPMAYNFQRIWGSVGSEIFFSGGPDTLVGNPNEAFDEADEFPFLSSVVRAVSSTQGLIVYTNNSIEMIQGGPATASFFSITLSRGVGLGNYNALDVFAGEQFFMDTNGQLRVLSPTLSLTSAGQPITDQLIKFNPATAYVAFHEQPNDSAIYVGTGSSAYNGNTGWFRMNPRQIPGGPNGPEPVWSPFAAISGGCQLLQSIEVSPGQKRLLVGALAGNTSILERNRSVFTDNGTQYTANFQIGSIIMAHRGELALVKFIESDFALVTTAPTVSFLLNEISGNFTNFPKGIFDPPSVYGATLAPSSYNPLRFYFGSTNVVATVIHMQVGVDFGTSSNADEIFNLTIYGAISKGR